MPPYFVIEKKRGETPLLALARLRQEKRIPPHIPLTYAGRLDPMAEGKLLVLVGEECKRQRAYHGLDKEYRFEILFGFSSDTGDILGVPKRGEDGRVKADSLMALARKIRGVLALPYPHFSSKTVKGKPLFLWTLENRLDEIEIPIAKTHIHHVYFEHLRTVPYEELSQNILGRINALPAVTEESKELGKNWRRAEILPAWRTLLHKKGEAKVATFSATVSSGTYIRSLAPYIAEKLGADGLAYSINRTEIGTYWSIPGTTLGLWIKRYH